MFLTLLSEQITSEFQYNAQYSLNKTVKFPCTIAKILLGK